MVPNIGRVGVWAMDLRFGDTAAIDAAAAELDELGYGALWIPGGIDDGAQIRISNEGDAGSRGGPSGNLYVLVRVQPHTVFAREDDALIYELPLNVAQAALGSTVEVPTIDGDPVMLNTRGVPPHRTAGLHKETPPPIYPE